MPKSTLDSVLRSVLSVANAEQNFAYAPFVFDSHFNIVTAFALDGLSRIYPTGVDALLPFMKEKVIPVTDGYVKAPADYRNMLGVPSVTVNAQGKDCGNNDPVIIDTASEFKTAQLKAGCKTYPIQMVDKAEWDARTTSTYAFPTYKDPIGMWTATPQGDKAIKVCPYDLTAVKLTYTRKEKTYLYGYIVQPDDTFIFNLLTSVESEWEEPAFSLLFKGVLALYSAYSRDKSLTEYSQILNNAGLF